LQNILDVFFKYTLSKFCSCKYISNLFVMTFTCLISLKPLLIINKFVRSNKLFRRARQDSYKVMAEYYSGMNLYMDILEWVVVIA
ncbi:hypothetical protein ACTPEF_26740, partial [Clostridioides difficile]